MRSTYAICIVLAIAVYGCQPADTLVSGMTSDQDCELRQLLSSFDSILIEATSETEIVLAMRDLLFNNEAIITNTNIVDQIHELLINSQNTALYRDLWCFDWAYNVETDKYDFLIRISTSDSSIWELIFKHYSMEKNEYKTNLLAEIISNKAIYTSFTNYEFIYDEFEITNSVDKLFVSLYFIFTILNEN